MQLVMCYFYMEIFIKNMHLCINKIIIILVQINNFFKFNKKSRCELISSGKGHKKMITFVKHQINLVFMQDDSP